MKTAEENNVCTIFLEGEINAQNVPALQRELDAIFAAQSGKEFIFKAKNLTYISSAGLRLLLGMQKNWVTGKSLFVTCQGKFMISSI